MNANQHTTDAGRVIHTVHDSVLGAVTIVGHDDTVTGLYFPGHWYRPSQVTFGTAAPGGFAEPRRQLDESRIRQ